MANTWSSSEVLPRLKDNIMKSVLGIIVGGGVMLTNAATTWAQDKYPARPVRVICAAAGGAVDIVARLVSQSLSSEMGQQFVVDNRGGPYTAQHLAVLAPADGYTLLVSSNTLASNPSIFANLPFDPIKDLAPVSTLAEGPLVLVMSPSFAPKNVKDLVSFAKSNPGKATFGSAGAGSPPNLTAELFKLVTRTDMLHVPYKGVAAALTDVAAGRLDLMFSSLGSVLPLVSAGRVRAIAVSTPKRAALMPDTPTLAEAGFPDVVVTSWVGMLAPARTPPSILSALNRQIQAITKSQELRERMSQNGFEATSSSQKEFADFLRLETEQWRRVVKAAGITPN